MTSLIFNRSLMDAARRMQKGSNTQSHTLDREKIQNIASLANGKATRIGCAQRNCNDNLYIACVVDDESPNTPAPGSATEPTPSEIASPLLLTSTATSTTTTPSTTTVTTSSPTTPISTSAVFTMAEQPAGRFICPPNDISTDEVRNVFLTLHNQFRSSLALGSVPNGRMGILARKASRMIKLRYDCNAEYSAYMSAQRCVDMDSPQSSRPGFDENRHVSPNPNTDHVTMARRAANHWWNEMVTYGIPQGNNIFHLGLNIPHFAKMAWDTHERVGCAVFKCPTFIHAVCHYGPGGFAPGRRIYKMGPTCNECIKIKASKCVDGLCVLSKNGMERIHKPSFHDPSKQP
ncbi:hypothetical protein RB195_013143 [Necator americanus]|uniref:SCP domain-containing protein n=1 Tax=Necator americanus TaxID=51031 RepID=A0ABR1DWU3_NECAM